MASWIFYEIKRTIKRKRSGIYPVEKPIGLYFDLLIINKSIFITSNVKDKHFDNHEYIAITHLHLPASIRGNTTELVKPDSINLSARLDLI